ncbi:MAG: rod shape-determining protein RodA, partial [Paludibacteraceae bacterium]|nr:rod shape-determining protein RodA [Paludibacteraceae bacterium]
MAIFGWLNVYEASYTFDQTSIFDFSYRSGKQIVWLATALLMGGIIMLLDSRIFDVGAYVLYGIILLILIATPFLARDIKGSMSWISLGPVSLQPAEFAKCITALALAKYMSRYEYRLRTWRDMVVPLIILGLPMLIIMVWQKETGSALVLASFVLMFYRQGMSGLVLVIGVAAVALFITVIKFGLLPALIIIVVFTLLYLGRALYFKFKPFSRVKPKILLPVLLSIAAVGFSLACNTVFEHLPDHQRSRIEVLLGMKDDPQGAGYNVKQSLIAIGSGGLTGKGFLKGTQTKMHFVPEQATDFIFCTVGEEWGFIGSSLLL